MARAIKSPSDVLVDLSELAFADTSLMLDLAMLARRVRGRGAALRLHDPQEQIRTLIELVGLHRLDGVTLEARTPALT